MSTVITDPQTCFVIWGEAPEEDWANPAEKEGDVRFGAQVARPVEIEFLKDAADAFVMRNTLGYFSAFIGKLAPGGTISVIINRAPDEGEATTNGSFVINNPDEERHVWEFRVQRRKAVV